MSKNTENRISLRGQDTDLSSPSPAQGSGSDRQLTQGDEVSSVFNLFVSVTNRKSTGSIWTFEFNSYKRKHNANPHGNAKVSRHASMESVSSESEEIDVEEEEESTQDVVLAELLRRECIGLRGLAEAWARTYKSAPYEGIRSMLELILHSSGILLPITIEQAMKLDELTLETFNETMSDPEMTPLILETRFIKNLLNFLKLTLTREVCLGDILLMRRIHCLLTVFSKSTWVSARYAALIFGSLLTVQYAEYISEIDLELRGLLIRISNEESNLDDELAVAKNFFEQYVELVNVGQRDVVYTIRKLGCEIFCSWCVKEEPLLMDDKYLRYVYFSLFDESPSIRRLAILTCSKLCKSADVCRKLPIFVEKFKKCVMRRVLDVSDRVAAAAMDTISDFQRSASWLLNGVYLENVFKFIFSDVEWKSARAAEILHRVCDSMSTNSATYIHYVVLFAVECSEEITKDYDEVYTTKRLVKSLFHWSNHHLTDWVSWRKVLMGFSLDHSKKMQEMSGLMMLEVINLVSIYAGDRFSAETDFPSMPKLNPNESDANKQSNGTPEEESLKTDYLNLLVEMTSVFGPQVLHLWKKFQENQTCLVELVKIPQYFVGNIDTFDIKFICSNLVRLRDKMSSSPSMDAIHRSLACIYRLMSCSEKWKPSIPKLEKVLFKSVTENFFHACTTLMEEELETHARIVALKTVKQAFYLTKFFDVTKTSLLDDCLKALRLGSSKNKPKAEIVCPTTMMCLYILEWQLKVLIEQHQTRNSMDARLNKIQTQARILSNQLENLIKDERTIVRETAYGGLCRLHSAFSSSNIYSGPFPSIHLPPLQLDVAEWINYVVECNSPAVPQNEEKFQSSSSSLELFCSLLKVQVLDMAYMSTALRYFRFHNQPENYNSILESTFQALATSNDFPKMFVDSLVWMKSRAACNVEETAKGFCAVVLPVLSPRKLFRKITYEIISYGIFCIRNQSHFFIFKALAYFIKLYDMKNILLSMESKVKQTFAHHPRNDELKTFLAVIHERRLELARRGPQENLQE